MTQSLVIHDWHPTSSANAQRRHWRDVQRRHHADRDKAWVSALQAGWTEVPGKVLLTITLVYPRKYRVDADNLAAKCKGLIDGLKAGHAPEGRKFLAGFGNVKGFFEDDDTEHLDLKVTAVVEPGVKETRIRLEPAPLTAADYDRVFRSEEEWDTAGDLKVTRPDSDNSATRPGLLRPTRGRLR